MPYLPCTSREVVGPDKGQTRAGLDQQGLEERAGCPWWLRALSTASQGLLWPSVALSGPRAMGVPSACIHHGLDWQTFPGINNQRDLLNLNVPGTLGHWPPSGIRPLRTHRPVSIFLKLPVPPGNQHNRLRKTLYGVI